MAAKPSGCLGRVLSAAFTSVVAPVLVGLALHGLNGGAAPPDPAETARLGDAALRDDFSAGAPRAPIPRPAPGQPTGARPVARHDVDWTHPVPLGR